MSYRMYPVGFGHFVAPWNVLKTVEYFASYEEARKAVMDHRNKPDPDKYSLVQLGCDDQAELMVYKPEFVSWVVTAPCWTKDAFDKFGKVCKLRVPIKTTKDQMFKLAWGWDKSVLDLFTIQYGVKFFDVKETWKNHFKDGATSKQDYLEYSCLIPDAAKRPIKESYGCVIG